MKKIIWKPSFHQLKRLAVSLARKHGIKPVNYNINCLVEKLVNRDTWHSLWLPLMDESQAIPVEPKAYFYYTRAEFTDTLDYVLDGNDRYGRVVSESIILAQLIHKVRKPDFKSPSGSEYYYTKEGLFRLANHWNNVASCEWSVNFDTEVQWTNRMCYVKWSDIHPIPNSERNVFYYYRELSEDIKQALIDAGLIVFDYYGFVDTHSSASYEEVMRFVNDYKSR